MPEELLADRLYRLDLGRVNAYLVDDGDVTLVDAGMPGDAGAIRRHLDAAGYDAGDLDRVLVTHFDIDHVGALSAVAPGVPVYAMDPDAGFLDGARKPPLSNHKGILQRLLSRRLSRPSTPVRRVSDEESVGGFVAYHTPGHTPGHAVYVHDDVGLALLGDLAVAATGGLRTAPWYYAYSASKTVESVRVFADRDLAFEIAAPGHGRPITTGGARAFADWAGQLA